MFNIIRKISRGIEKVYNFEVISPKYVPMTQLFVFINISVFILQRVFPNITEVYVFRSDCWYSYITACFLHSSFKHLASNMLFLCFIFPIIEERYSSFFIFIAYLVTGAFGSIFTALFIPSQIGLGASGSVMGIMMIWIFHNLLEWKLLLTIFAILLIATEGMKAGQQIIGLGKNVGYLCHFGSALGAFFFLPIIVWKKLK